MKEKLNYKTLLVEFGSIIRENVSLAKMSSFCIGGPADLFAEISDPDQFVALAKRAKELNIRTFILGGGSNTLFHENGFRGLIIRPTCDAITIDEPSSISGSKNHEGKNSQKCALSAQAGTLLATVVQKAVEQGFKGIEVWVGLPGTVGGAVRGNAGAHNLEIKDILQSALLYNLKTGEKRNYANHELNFGYRHSLLKDDPDLVLLSATFVGEKEIDPESQRRRMVEILKGRNISQPKGQSAGCIFKNPEPGVSSGKLIDEVGLKGAKQGDIEISTTHGNFFLNHGKGTQADVLQLIALVKQKVEEKHGIQLCEEIKIVPE